MCGASVILDFAHNIGLVVATNFPVAIHADVPTRVGLYHTSLLGLDPLLWTLYEGCRARSEDSLTKKLGKPFAARDISSVIARAKPENGSEQTKADERIRKR